MKSLKDPSKFLHKIWHVKCSNKEFAEALERHCNGEHDHVAIAGNDTEHSGGYPTDLAKTVTHTFAQLVR